MTKKIAVKGQGLIEYALIMLLVALAVIVVLAVFGPAVGTMYSNAIPLL
jgi:pilus assembly protein Flp/PilA